MPFVVLRDKYEGSSNNTIQIFITVFEITFNCLTEVHNKKKIYIFRDFSSSIYWLTFSLLSFLMKVHKTEYI